MLIHPRIINPVSRECTYEFKAHSAEVTDIAVFEDSKMLLAASAGRDRTIQVFRCLKHDRRGDENVSWHLLQTLEDHVGAVTGLLFSNDGQHLISRSSDRTVVVRKFASSSPHKETDETSDGTDRDSISGFLIDYTITLKASPVAMALEVQDDSEGVKKEEKLWVSTIDRHLHRYKFRNGHSLSSFKVADSDNGDAVVISALLPVRLPAASISESTLLACVSSTDKSVRLYSTSGKLLCKDWGHTEGITAIELLQPQKIGSTEPSSGGIEKPEGLVRNGDVDEHIQTLVTAAVDGTIFLWNLKSADQNQQINSGRTKSVDHLNGIFSTPSGTPTKASLCARKPPLRKVLSQSELARLQRSPAILPQKNKNTNDDRDDDDGEDGGESANSTTTSNTTGTTATTNTSTSSPISTPTKNRARSPGLRKKSSRLSIAQTPRIEAPPRGISDSDSAFSGKSMTDKNKSGAGNNGYDTVRRRASIASRRSPSPTSRLHTQPHSPTSPRGRRLTHHEQQHLQKPKPRRKSMEPWSRTSTRKSVAPVTEAGRSGRISSLQASNLCMDLRAYREGLCSVGRSNHNGQKDLRYNSDPTSPISPSSLTKMEAELDLTLQAVKEHISLIAELTAQSSPTGTDNTPKSEAVNASTTGLESEAKVEQLLDRYSDRLVDILDRKMGARSLKDETKVSTELKTAPTKTLARVSESMEGLAIGSPPG